VLPDQPAQPPAQTVVLPAGAIVEHDNTGLVLIAPDGSAVGSLFRDEETGAVGYLIMSGATGRTMSGVYQAIPFPEQFNVLITQHSDRVQLTVNLPTELTQDFVLTFIEFSMEAHGVNPPVLV